LKEKILRKLLEKIRGLKKGDYVRYRWKETKEWFYGRISSIVRVKVKLVILSIQKKV